MAAYAALVSLMNNMEQIMNHPRLSNCFDNEQIHSLLQKSGSLLEFIEGYINHGGGLFTEGAEDLEREITRAAHAAEDVVESHVVDQIHAGTLFSTDLQQVIRDMGAVAERAVEVMEKEGLREEEQRPLTYPRPHVESGGTTTMVGLEDELTQLLDSLTNHHLNRHVISIVGMGGMGKTILAQNLYAHPLVKERFDIRAWATVSQQYDSQDILSQLISCLGKKSDNVGGELGEQVHKTLFRRRYLIILDDIWDVEAWDKVRRYFPDDGNGSRVVLTTRLSNIASDCGSACFDMNLLDEGRSWELFCVKAFFPHKDDPHQLEDVAKDIVKSCKGLALSIVVIGGLLLNSPRTVEYWTNVLKGLRSTDSKEKQQGLDALSLSYTHLPPRLKPCFLYMGVFKEDYRIRASKITKMWVAEGFIKPKGNRVLEEMAEDYLKDLSDRNLVIVVERRFTGKIKSFSIHDLVRDLCIRVSEQQEFFQVRESGGTNGTERRLVCDPYEREVANALARTILRRMANSHSIRYDKFRLLRVSDGTENKDVRLEAEIYGNVNLRYVAHRLLPCTRVLSSACLLMWNLQTLIMRKGYLGIIVVAPLEIWTMRQLRHVTSGKFYLPDPPRNKQGCMENLQTLTGALNLRLSEEVCQTIPNIKKLGLIYDYKLHGYDDSLIDCLHNLDRFHNLESLNMDVYTRSFEYTLHLKLAFPLSLSKLCLKHCDLRWKDLSMMIGSLPQLQFLYLNYDAVKAGYLWSPISLHLKFLKIKSCPLRSWEADSSHFPVLEKLVLSNLYFLEEIPLEIGEIPTLTLIRVIRCALSAAVSAVKIKKYQVENYENYDLQIEVKVNSRDLESFKKRLEEEELALNLLNKLETWP